MFHLLSRLGRWARTSGPFSWRYPITADPDENLGLAGEQFARRYLYRLGYRIIEHSHRQQRGEIDLIALDGSQIVFAEVKTWRDDSIEDPSAAVDFRKQERLTRAALIYLRRHNLMHRPARFDVLSIVWPVGATEPRLRHFRNAFEATGRGGTSA